MQTFRCFLLSVFILPIVLPAWSGEVDVVGVEIKRTGDRLYRFDVTLKHKDTGWDHYANRWEIRSPDGKVLGVRALAHPHVKEQPFTRSLGNVKIPAGMEKVEVFGRDSVHGYGGKTIIVKVPD